jgi:RNA polymerase sigma factor (sigma-70 family)
MAKAQYEPSGEGFQTTRWSVVVAAADGAASSAAAALSYLCQRYWPPLYAYVRRSGYSIHDAQELTQEFFTRLLDKNYLLVVDPLRGRFRSFLLAALKHFLSNQRKATRAKKRGGGRAVVSWDFAAAEAGYRAELADTFTPERIFERRWALLLLDRVLANLEAEFVAASKKLVFHHLKGLLTADGAAPSYRHVADQLGMTEAAVKMAVHRLRRRYRQLLRAEIAQTVSGPHDVDDELRQLLAVLAGGRST